jgi:hypothetical protein
MMVIMDTGGSAGSAMLWREEYGFSMARWMAPTLPIDKVGNLTLRYGGGRVVLDESY